MVWLGGLNIHSRRDIKAYMEEINNGSSTLLMNVTSGYHYHNSCTG
ncbi:MAG: 3H domain-containing protein [Lachnospira pectinoschiza]